MYSESVKYWVMHVVAVVVPIALPLCLAVASVVAWSLSDRGVFRVLLFVCGPAFVMACCLAPLSLLGDMYISLLQAVWVADSTDSSGCLATDVLDLAPRLWWTSPFVRLLRRRPFRSFMKLYLERIRWALRCLDVPLVVVFSVLTVLEFTAE
mmetsp:Transcript_119276/g.371565  ORF Transcript_119276/g.371565 Transcript_119276/m.371565 type:complete len:152 (+) Transcript_119276:261-716(+)